ncbi:MAG: Wzz/FepE/Etk N-terminal domain-containing protein [Terracidiphilus sp.]
MSTDTSPSELREHADPSSGASPAVQIRKDNEISLLDLLIVLAERKNIILGVTAVFAILAIIISLVLPKRYTATVTLLPPQQGSSIGAGLSSQLGSLGGMAALAGGSLGLKSPNDMYVALFKSRTVEDAMAERFGLMQEYHAKHLSDAGKLFEGHTKVDASGKDGLIRISVDDSDPQRAAMLANGYVDQFRNMSQHLAITEAAQRRLFFEQQLQQAKENLANAEEALKKTQESTGLIEPEGQAHALIESATALRAQIASKEVEIESMRTFATGENSQVVQAQQELESLRAQLAKLLGSNNPSDATLMLPKGRVPEAGLEYLRKFRDVKYYETMFDILARQFEAAKLDEAKQGALIQVVDPAVPPDWRSFPRRGLIVIVATLVGFVFGIFVALGLGGFQRAKDVPEVSQKLNILRDVLSFRRRSVPKS